MTLAEVLNVVAAALLSVGGAAGFIVLLSKYFGERLAERWLESVRAQHAKDLARIEHELEELGRRTQARLDHAVTVSRAQFDAEFTALRDIWPKIFNLLAAINDLRPNFAIVPVDDTNAARQQRLFERLTKAKDAFNPALEAVHGNSPFYPQEIFETLRGAMDIARFELTDVETNHMAFRGEWFEQGRQNREEFKALVDAASALIRERLAKLRIRDE